MATDLNTIDQTAGMGELSTPHRSGLPAAEVERRNAFAALMTPCLQLVAPAGMSKEERKAWLAAADRALAGLPADLLRAACQSAAMRKADHPAKIIPAIEEAVGAEWRRRQRLADYPSPPPALPALPAPEADLTDPKIIAAMRPAWRSLGLAAGYLAPEVVAQAEAIEAERRQAADETRRGQRRDRAQQHGAAA